MRPEIDLIRVYSCGFAVKIQMPIGWPGADRLGPAPSSRIPRARSRDCGIQRRGGTSLPLLRKVRRILLHQPFIGMDSPSIRDAFHGPTELRPRPIAVRGSSLSFSFIRNRINHPLASFAEGHEGVTEALRTGGNAASPGIHPDLRHIPPGTVPSAPEFSRVGFGSSGVFRGSPNPPVEPKPP
jgi:hypothetical protein